MPPFAWSRVAIHQLASHSPTRWRSTPVLFGNYTDLVAPLFWGSWREHARVLVPRAPFVQGSLDLLSLLRAIPAAHVEKMQTALAQHKKSFLYSLNDDTGGDAVDLLLRNLNNMAFT